jgi:septum formation topological specificity factor MinE
MANKKKPNGYWDDFSNLERELLEFIEQQATPGVMPTHEELIKAGRGDISGATKKYGHASVAEKLGLTYTKKQHGYWNDFANVERELLNFIEKWGSSGVMPTLEELKNAEQSSIASAINKHGGCQAVAERLGLVYAHKRHGYWEDFTNIKREVLAFIKEYGTSGMMPTQSELKKGGRSDLASAIQKRHSGYQSVAEQMGLTYAKKRNGYWNDFANVERELLSFIAEYGTVGVMPTKEELKKASCKNLASAIDKQDLRNWHIVTENLTAK